METHLTYIVQKARHDSHTSQKDLSGNLNFVLTLLSHRPPDISGILELEMLSLALSWLNL